jgi:hypothetical protein
MKAPVSLLILSLLTLLACRSQHADFAEGLSLYRQNALEDARSVFARLAEEEPSNVQVLAYLAETYRRTGASELAVETARRALAIDSCNAFAHCVLAEAMDPLVRQWSGANADSSWAHLLKAAECDPENGTPWLMIWGQSIHRGQGEMTAKAARRMIETGFFADALLSYTRWVLRSLPPEAILLTNGDMDTYPVAAVQEVEGLRTDVVMVNRGTLNELWYARYIRDAKGVPLPYTDSELEGLSAREGTGVIGVSSAEEIVAGWIRMLQDGRLSRPVTFASTIPETYMDRFKKPLQFCGAYTVVRAEEVDRPDVKAIEAGLSQFAPEDFFGLWVSDQDRSPARAAGTRNIVRNVTHSALTLAEQAALRGDAEAFARWLAFARRLDNGSDLGPVYADRMRQIEARGVPPR